MEEVQCENCGWQGGTDELVCTDEEFFSDKETGEVIFSLCPNCKSDNIVDVE
jgi:predicted Zn-ribbon and HTH transcriptional regulator